MKDIVSLQTLRTRRQMSVMKASDSFWSSLTHVKSSTYSQLTKIGLPRLSYLIFIAQKVTTINLSSLPRPFCSSIIICLPWQCVQQP